MTSPRSTAPAAWSKRINLRTIVLRDAEGTVHVFPNGAITTLANRSKDFSYYVIDLRVSYYDEDRRGSRRCCARSAPGCRRTPRSARSSSEPLEILGVDGFGDWWMRAEGADQDRAAEAVVRRP